MINILLLLIKHFNSKSVIINCNHDTYYSPSCLGQKTAKGPFDLRVNLPVAHLSTTPDGGFTLSLQSLSKRRSCEYQFL